MAFLQVIINQKRPGLFFLFQLFYHLAVWVMNMLQWKNKLTLLCGQMCFPHKDWNLCAVSPTAASRTSCNRKFSSIAFLAWGYSRSPGGYILNWRLQYLFCEVKTKLFFEARGEVLNHGKKIPEQVDEVGFKISGKAWAPKRIDSEPLFCVTVWYIELNRST